MLDIGWQEFFIIAVVAVIIIGPKDLPRALKTIAQFVRKARSFAREFQNGLDDMVREAELDDLKNEIKGATPSGLKSQIEEAIDPTGDLKDSIREMDPTAEVREALDVDTEPAEKPEEPAARPVEEPIGETPEAEVEEAEPEAEPPRTSQASG